LKADSFRQCFDLHPHTSTLVDISHFNERKAAFEFVWMHYAADTSRSGLPPGKFPHRLTIEVSADNLVYPMTQEYVLRLIDGMLKLDVA
jgi:hypothetical protein